MRSFRDQYGNTITMPYSVETSKNSAPSSHTSARMWHTTQPGRDTATTYPAISQQRRVVPTYVATRAPVETPLLPIPPQQKAKPPSYNASSTPGQATPVITRKECQSLGIVPQPGRVVPTYAAIDPPPLLTKATAAATQEKRVVPTYTATNPPSPTTQLVIPPMREQNKSTSTSVTVSSRTPTAIVPPQQRQPEPKTGAADTSAETPHEQSYRADYERRSTESNIYNNMQNYGIHTPRASQPADKQWQQQHHQPRSNAGFAQAQRPPKATSPPATGPTQNRQTSQQPSYQNPRQTQNQSVYQTSLQQPQQQPKPKKATVPEVVQSLKQILEGYDGHRFTLEGIDALYRVMKGNGIPYSALGYPSLSSFIESQCAFLTIFAGADGTTQILLRPPSYQEAVYSPTSLNPVGASLQEKHNVSNLVHDEISQADYNRLKGLIASKARNGLTIQELDNLHLAEFQTRIDFKGFSRTGFFRGLDDIVEMREDRDGIKLYSKTGPQNAPKTPNKTPAPQNNLQKPQQSVGNRSQPSPGKKNQHGGGQSPQHGNNNKQHPRQQQQQHQHQQQGPHQARRQQQPQQSRNRSQSSKRDAKPELVVEPFYEKELKKMLQQCKTPGGVTIKAFKKHFKENSSLEWRTFDRSDVEFFTGLPHIFQISRGNDGIRLMPKPLTSGLARNNFSNWQSTSVLEGAHNGASREKVSASVGNLSSTPECSMRMLMGGRCLWIVSIENYEYVPTGCVAKLANMAKDTVINDLRKHSLEIRYIRKLEDQNIKRVLVNNNVARPEELVMTIPLKSVPIILRAFLGRDVDDAFMANLEEVSKEHVRNKRFGRPNRQ